MRRPLAPPSSVHAVVLAAGASHRFGATGAKALARFAGESLLRRAACHALDAGVAAVAVVVPGGDAALREELRGLAVTVVENPKPERGPGSSVALAVAALPATATAVLFLPVDQPLLTGAHLRRLVDAHHDTGADVVVARAAELRGAPALFGRRHFPALRGLAGEAGARPLLAAARHLVQVGLDDPWALEDADTPERLRELEGRAGLPPGAPSGAGR